MRTTMLTTLAVLGIATPMLGQTSPASSSAVEGVVRSRFDERVEVLAYAMVEARSSAGAHATHTDSAGFYILRGLPEGEIRLRVSHAGHEPILLTVHLPAEETVRVDLELIAEPVELPQLDVRSPREDDQSAEAPTARGLPELDLQSLEASPGVGSPGLLDAVRALPGNDPANATDVLFMRGSTTDMKLVLLNGVPVYTPFHVAGIMRSFEPSVLSRADLHVGGAPARYDGGLSHILELRTRRARRDRVRLSGSLDFMSASVAAEAPLGEHVGVIASARSLHDLGQAPLGGSRPYGYRDLLLSVDAEPAEGHALTATGFWNDESVRLDFDQRPDDAVWSNRAGSVQYVTDVRGARVDVTAGASAYNAELPLQPTGDPAEPLPPPLRASAQTDRLRLVAEASWGAPATPWRAGFSLERIDAAFAASGSASSVFSRAKISSAGAFVDVTRPLSPGVTLRAGLRGDLFGGRIALVAPRAALHWEVGPEALLSLAAGRYHQPTRTPDFEVERTLAEVAHDGVPPGQLLPVATADHVVVSLDQHLAGKVRLGLEGFWKRYDGLLASREETIRSSGVDVRVLSSADRGVLWLGYGLSWFWSTVDLSGHASDFAGRHLLTAGMSGQLVGPLRGEGRVAYGAGLPYTSIPFRNSEVLNPGSIQDSSDPGPGEQLLGDSASESPIVGGLDEAFLRLDLEVYALLEPTWGGRTWQIRPYVRLLNALNRRDALFYTFQRWRPDSVTPLAERPMLPLLGLAFSF